MPRLTYTDIQLHLGDMRPIDLVHIHCLKCAGDLVNRLDDGELSPVDRVKICPMEGECDLWPIRMGGEPLDVVRACLKAILTKPGIDLEERLDLLMRMVLCDGILGRWQA